MLIFIDDACNKQLTIVVGTINCINTHTKATTNGEDYDDRGRGKVVAHRGVCLAYWYYWIAERETT